jgi:uncharacterized protein YjiS (DUF1127 family)
MTTTTIDRSGTATPSVLRLVPEIAGRIIKAVVEYAERARAEQQLASLDDRLLRDIGVSRADIHSMVWGGGR